MADPNYVPIVITPAEMVINLGLIEDLAIVLPSSLINLTPGQRKSFLKAGDKTLAFCTKALEIANATPDLIPKFVDVAVLAKNVKAASDLLIILRAMEILTTKLSDSSLLAGKQGYIDCLLIYNNIRKAAERNITGAKVAYEDLKVRFPGRKRKTPVVPPTT